MQNYTELASTVKLNASLLVLLNNTKTVMSNHSGTAFPTTNLQVGMNCHRTDTNETYKLKSASPDVWKKTADLDQTYVDKEYVDTQLGAKEDAITGAASTITGTDLTASRALASNASGKVVVSAATATELGYLSGVTSAVQTQLNAKAATAHTHSLATISANGFMSAADKTKLDNLGTGSGLDATGTSMLFRQTVAPTGWTKSTTHDNKALRVVSGTISNGGANSFTTVFGAGKATGGRSLSVAQLASHRHTETSNSSGGYTLNLSSSGGATTNYTGYTGSGSTHDHALTMDLQYIDLIIAVKD